MTSAFCGGAEGPVSGRLIHIPAKYPPLFTGAPAVCREVGITTSPAPRKFRRLRLDNKLPQSNVETPCRNMSEIYQMKKNATIEQVFLLLPISSNVVRNLGIQFTISRTKTCISTCPFRLQRMFPVLRHRALTFEVMSAMNASASHQSLCIWISSLNSNQTWWLQSVCKILLTSQSRPI